MKFLTSIGLLCIFLPILILVLFTPEKCEHESVTRYVFTSYDSTAKSSVCDYCKKCDTRISAYSNFEGTLVDQSYLSAVIVHSDADEMIPGEYYTITAKVPLGYTGYKNHLTCEVENEDFIVRFSAEFRAELWEQINAVEKGSTITFRGRFYDTGCGFTDCVLVE